jgi:prolyl 4-hydroxylase
MCAVWAAEGFCDMDSEDYEWMVLNCAPVCQTCELLDFQIRCPIPDDAMDALNTDGGDNGLHSMFERIVGKRNLTEAQIHGGMQNLSYDIQIYSRPGGSKSDTSENNIIDGPWVVALDNFLSMEECQRLIEIGQKLGYQPSLETSTLKDGSLKEDFTSDARTSTNTWCNDDMLEDSDTSCKDDATVKTIMERISLVTGFPMDNSEDLQLLHYTPGQYYKIHHDYIAAHAYGPSGPRVLTFFLYLNDVEEGGGTRFPALSPNAAPVTVQPKAGKALLWPSVLDENIYEKDERTEHEALTVTKGVKFGANAWLHLRDEQNVHGIECG